MTVLPARDSIPDQPDPVLAQRRRLGPIEMVAIGAGSMVEAHGALGTRIAGAAIAAIDRRIDDTPASVLAGQIAVARAGREFMLARVGATRSDPIGATLAEYFDCLDAWARAIGLEARLDRVARVVGGPLRLGDLALWTQDDNTGCQTGMLRRADRSVLLWHTEEDTIGYFDRPRIARFAIAGRTYGAFLYPYLLPGPAFGWCDDQVHAVDSLHVRRDLTRAGSFSCVASWMMWRLGGAAEPVAILRLLSPFVDGCAVNLVRAGSPAPPAAVHEFGGRWRLVRRLAGRPGAFTIQANAISRPSSRLGAIEDLPAHERAPYHRRVARTERAMSRLLARPAEPAPADLLALLASRRGGHYGYANADVMGHCVAAIDREGVRLHVGSGAAHPEDAYSPRWQNP